MKAQQKQNLRNDLVEYGFEGAMQRERARLEALYGNSPIALGRSGALERSRQQLIADRTAIAGAIGNGAEQWEDMSIAERRRAYSLMGERINAYDARNDPDRAMAAVQDKLGQRQRGVFDRLEDRLIEETSYDADATVYNADGTYRTGGDTNGVSRVDLTRRSVASQAANAQAQQGRSLERQGVTMNAAQTKVAERLEKLGLARDTSLAVNRTRTAVDTQNQNTRNNIMNGGRAKMQGAAQGLSTAATLQMQREAAGAGQMSKTDGAMAGAMAGSTFGWQGALIGGAIGYFTS